MGDRPFPRVNPLQRPFLATGIDFTGAIEIKQIAKKLPLQTTLQ